jgi:hypothetical protein
MQMPIFERPFQSLEELHETELEYLKQMFACGAPIAIPAALFYCARHGLNAPRWLVVEAAKMLCAHLGGSVPRERGRSCGIINRYRQDAVDHARWEAVIEVRENRNSLRKDIETLRRLPGHKARDILNERSKLLDWAGTNNDDAFECASLLLADTAAHGKPDAIRRSYLRVEKNVHTPATAMRYRILETQFLRLVGVDIARPIRPGKKIVPLYDLTA